jgi:uracil-DNA glycosylase
MDQNTANVSIKISPQQAAAMLDWLLAMGADEIVGETACNRFEMVPASAEVRKNASVERPTPSVLTGFQSVPGHPPPPQAKAEHVDADSVAELASAFAGFEGCGLRKAAMNFCFVQGNLESRVLVMGDRPRTTEDKEGQVFAGKNAALLEAMLKAIGLSISDEVMLANFIPWRPPGNRPVTDIEAKACLPFAARLVEIVKPAAILLLGGLPGQWLAGGDQSIAKQRGKWMDIAGVPAIATFHPDDLMRTQTLKKLAWGDLKLFRNTLDEQQGAS